MIGEVSRWVCPENAGLLTVTYTMFILIFIHHFHRNFVKISWGIWNDWVSQREYQPLRDWTETVVANHLFTSVMSHKAAIQIHSVQAPRPVSAKAASQVLVHGEEHEMNRMRNKLREEFLHGTMLSESAKQKHLILGGWCIIIQPHASYIMCYIYIIYIYYSRVWRWWEWGWLGCCVTRSHAMARHDWNSKKVAGRGRNQLHQQWPLIAMDSTRRHEDRFCFKQKP